MRCTDDHFSSFRSFRLIWKRRNSSRSTHARGNEFALITCCQAHNSSFISKISVNKWMKMMVKGTKEQLPNAKYPSQHRQFWFKFLNQWFIKSFSLAMLFSFLSALFFWWMLLCFIFMGKNSLHLPDDTGPIFCAIR